MIAAASDDTRGVIFGGYAAPAYTDTIEYVTIASLGDAIDFGNLSTAALNGGAVSNNTRGVYYLGDTTPGGNLNTIEYVNIQTLGNSIDFGDVTVTRKSVLACFSDSHGGLG